MKSIDNAMDLEVKVIDESQNEYVKIGCHRVDARIKGIVDFVKMQQDSVEGLKDQQHFRIPIADIYYVESVDEQSFIYLKKDCYESRKKLYEFEDLLSAYHFARISKSIVVNLMKIKSIKPALNGRFLCRMLNDEEVIISRKYVPEIKKILKGNQ